MSESEKPFNHDVKVCGRALKLLNYYEETYFMPLKGSVLSDTSFTKLALRGTKNASTVP